MSRPIVFDCKSKKTLKHKTFELERQVQRIVEENLEKIFNIRLLCTEFAFTDSESGNGRMDTIGLDNENRPVIIEYKLDKNENVINQALFYINWLKNHKSDFKWLVYEKLGEEASKTIEWSPRAICIASSFGKYDPGAINQMNADIMLYQYYVYGDNKELIAFENINSRKEEVKLKQQKKNVELEENSSEEKNNKYERETFLYIYSNSSDEWRKLIDNISNKILEISPDISSMILSRYKSFRREVRFASMVITKSKIHIYVKVDYNKSFKEFVNVKDVSNIGHWGGSDKVRIEISSIEDLDKTFWIIKKAFNEN